MTLFRFPKIYTIVAMKLEIHPRLRF